MEASYRSKQILKSTYRNIRHFPTFVGWLDVQYNQGAMCSNGWNKTAINSDLSNK